MSAPDLRQITPGGEWSYHFKTAFGERSVRLGTCNHREALKLVRDSRAEELRHAQKVVNLTGKVLNQIIVGRTHVTIKDALEEFLAWKRQYCTQESMNVVKSWLTNWLRDRGLLMGIMSDITVADMHAWVNPDDQTKLSTRRNRLQIVRDFMKWACIQYPLKPIHELVRLDHRKLTHAMKEPNKKKLWTDADLEQFLAFCKKRYDHHEARAVYNETVRRKLNRAVFEWRKERILFQMVGTVLGRYCGLRLGDVACLEWATLDMSLKKLVQVWTRKTGTRIEVPVPPIVYEYLALVPHKLDPATGKPSLYLFPDTRNRYVGEGEWEVAHYFTRDYQKAIEKAGLTGYTWHCGRHTFATHVEQQYGIRLAMEWLGHKREKTTEGYVHPEQLEPSQIAAIEAAVA